MDFLKKMTSFYKNTRPSRENVVVVLDPSPENTRILVSKGPSKPLSDYQMAALVALERLKKDKSYVQSLLKTYSAEKNT